MDIEQFLRGEIGADVDAEALRRFHLEAYAFCQLPKSHDLRPQLALSHRIQVVRHATIRQEVLALVQAWRGANLEVMLYKGFALAEFVYPNPAERHYVDVDILLLPKDAPQALEIALKLGWKTTYDANDTAFLHNHEYARIFSPSGLTRVEMAQFALQRWGGMDTGNRKRFTRACWANSIMVPWQGTTVRLLAGVDALLVGLYLNRAWGDGWTRKAHDLLDARYLVSFYGLSRQDLLARAETLRCKISVQQALQSCDPWLNHIRLNPPRRFWLKLRVAPELGWYSLEAMLNRLLHWPDYLRYVLPALGLLQRYSQLPFQLSDTDLCQLLKPLAQPSQPNPTPLSVIERTTYGVQRAAWLLHQTQHSLAQALALFALLQRKRLEIQFVGGYDGQQTHYWVEWQGRPLEGFGLGFRYLQFSRTFCFPAKP